MKRIFFTAVTVLLLMAVNGQNLNYETELNASALILKAEYEVNSKEKSWRYVNKWAKKTTKKAPHLYTDEVNKQADGIMDYRALSSTGSVYDRHFFESLLLGYINRYQMVNWAELMFTYNSSKDRIPFSKADHRYDPNSRFNN